jgi:hypothetical protein
MIGGKINGAFKSFLNKTSLDLDKKVKMAYTTLCEEYLRTSITKEINVKVLTNDTFLSVR